MKLRGKWTRKHSYHTAGIMVAVFMVIAAAGFWMVRSLLLENAQRLGNELANQYAELELQDVRSAELLLTAGVWTMEDLEASGADADRVEEWARNYFQETVDRFPNQLVPYAVIDGKVITPDGESDRTLEEMPWGGSGGAIRGGDPAFKYADRFGIRTDCHCGIPEVRGVIGCVGI